MRDPGIRLPNRESAYVPEQKLTEYLLSETHPDGRSKARLFYAAGFDMTKVNILEQGLISIAQTGHVEAVTTTVHGTKYVVDGTLTSPNGNLIQIRTVWIIDIGQYAPRLVTAYPA